jgi:hypothetical protein
MYRTFTILCLIGIFTSCDEPIALNRAVSHNLLIECELNPSDQMTAKVSELNDFNEVNRNSVVQDAVLRMSTGIDEEITFTYNKEKNEYFVPKDLHTVRIGQKYNLIVTRESDESIKYSTQAYVPSPIKMTSKVLSYEELKAGELVGKKAITINCSMPDANKSEFYLLKLYIHKNNNLEKLQFEGNSDDPLAFQESSIDGEIMMDVSRVNKSNFNLKFITASTIKPNDKVSRLHYTLSTITEAAYRYRISKHKQNRSAINSSIVPVTTFTNFDFGYGYLGACSAYSDTISIVK